MKRKSRDNWRNMAPRSDLLQDTPRKDHRHHGLKSQQRECDNESVTLQLPSPTVVSRRMLPYKIQWDGNNDSFAPFMISYEAYLIQSGQNYISQKVLPSSLHQGREGLQPSIETVWALPCPGTKWYGASVRVSASSMLSNFGSQAISSYKCCWWDYSLARDGGMVQVRRSTRLGAR